jgi:sortase A
MATHYTLKDGAKKRTGKKKVLTFLAIFFPIIGIVAGAYILFVIYSPTFINVPLISGRSGDETSKKLTHTPGTYGDRLFIPQINVDVAIVTGTTIEALDRGSWHRKPELGDPVKGGNFILSAHRFTMGLTPQQTLAKSPFYNIEKLQVGDQIYVDWQGKRYAYEISKEYEVKPNAVYIEDASAIAKMTLYSCTMGGSADGRAVFDAKPLGVVKDLKVSTR